MLLFLLTLIIAGCFGIWKVLETLHFLSLVYYSVFEMQPPR